MHGNNPQKKYETFVKTVLFKKAEHGGQAKHFI
jgi:hypothetical protein